MLWLAVLLKWLAVLACMAVGTLLLVTGAGIEIAAVKFKGLEVYGLPAGVVILIAGVALAKYWRVEHDERIERFVSPDGAESIVSTRIRRGLMRRE